MLDKYLFCRYFPMTSATSIHQLTVMKFSVSNDVSNSDLILGKLTSFV